MNEVIEVMELVGISLDKAQARQLVEKIDIDGSGTVSLEEFCSFVAPGCTETTIERRCCVAETDVVVLMMKDEDMSTITRNHQHSLIDRKVDALKRCPVFSRWSMNKLRRLAEAASFKVRERFVCSGATTRNNSSRLLRVCQGFVCQKYEKIV